MLCRPRRTLYLLLQLDPHYKSQLTDSDGSGERIVQLLVQNKAWR